MDDFGRGAFRSALASPGKEFPGAVCYPSMTGAAGAYLGAALTTDEGFTLLIAPGLPDADRLVDDLRLLTAHDPVRVLELPPPMEGDRGVVGTRLRTLAAIRAWPMQPYPCLVVASYPALVAPIPSGRVEPLALATEGADRLGFAAVCARFAAFGYDRVSTVSNEGEWAVRGGIVDAWSPGEEFPVRAEFFGEDLESIRFFDPAMQTSLKRIDRAEFLPVSDAAAANAPARLADILPPGLTVIALEHPAYDLRAAIPDLDVRAAHVVYTGDPAPRGVVTGKFLTSALPGFAELGAEEAHHPELFDQARARLEAHLKAARLRGDTVVELDGLSGGFEIPGLVVVAKSDRVFAKRTVRTRRTGSPTGARIGDFEQLEPGEYVVHLDYGVGKFVGSSEIVVDGRRSEVFTIEYADGGMLHVPAAHAHLLSRYVGVKGAEVRLHRLDGRRWTSDRLAAQQAVRDLAAALLDTQAKRETLPGYAYDVTVEGLEAFEAAFPYAETPDQEAAIAAVKHDLSVTRPMDRLICGDAGYGKTEVAMRAAFIAAMNGRQVAVLAPTTVLAEQHFETFTSRFDGTPVRIESMSRFQGEKSHRGTFDRLASGVCDIVIGTHAILSKRTAFHDLGLIIIDEEQRFGVRQKEFLKRLRATADVLTLSATPIPRTLYLSMTGARDLSLLRTPPRERVAVETRIVRDLDEIVKKAVETELARSGQVYYLHNRVTTIHRIEARLKTLCPAARVITAHGQMDTATLARKMRAFERGEADILLSTTIIESGIDIPRANTILIDRADTFGMADLYQLRGRVGRSARQGYAYLLLPPDGLVDSEARERLAALRRHGALGGGFDLAVRDLELRGAGNLLGSQQSGHIAAVGFSLYCQLLQRTVAMLRGEKVKDVVDVRLNLDFIDLSPASADAARAAALPYDYVEEDAQRMSFMKRFAEAADVRDVRALVRELEDRFGRLPPAARRFARLAELRVTAAAAGIRSIDTKGDRVILATDDQRIAKVINLTAKTVDRRLAQILETVKAAGAD